MRDTLMAVSQTLRSLFAKKSELIGFDDWDQFVGCIITIEQIADSIQNEKEVKENG